LHSTDNFFSRYSVALLSVCSEDYLQRTLSVALSEIITSEDDIEIVPTKISNAGVPVESIIHENLAKLKLTVSRLLELIVSSFEYCTLPMKQILYVVRSETKRRFSGDLSCDRASGTKTKYKLKT